VAAQGEQDSMRRALLLDETVVINLGVAEASPAGSVDAMSTKRTCAKSPTRRS
jgi:hypothetical protein